MANGVAGLDNMAGYLNIEGDAADVLDGGAGNDTLLAGDGDDLLKGGSEDDLLDGQAGNDALEGGDGADVLHGDGTQGDITVGGQDPYTLPQFHGDDYLDGGAGNDFLTGDGGSDALYGGEGDDILAGDAGNLAEEYHGSDYLDGGAGNDELYGYGKDDTLIGGAGDDLLEGDSNTVPFDKHGNDYLDGGDGDDVLWGDGGSDTLFGGTGGDQLFGDSDDTPAEFQGGDYLDGEAGDDYLRGYGGDDTLFGGDGVDQLLGDAGKDYLDGGAGDDLISGGEGNDELFGGEGADDLQGDAGDDYLAGEDGNDLLSGGSGSDQLSGDAGDDQLVGGDGNDVLDGGAGDDMLFGDAGNDTLNGGDGDDVLLGGSGTDALSGGAGNDQLGGDDGDDVVDGGAGDDLLFGDGGNDTLTGAEGADQIQGGDGNDNASGGEGDDRITGEAGDDLLAGDEGNDALQGGEGDDSLDGGTGDDTLSGEAGDDTLAGGAGDDYLYGGDGDDTYFYNPGDGVDHIVDTSAGGQVNTLVFGAGIDASQIKLELGSLMLDLGNGDVIHLDNFDPDDAVNSSSVQRFEFADGLVVGAEQLLARGFDLAGTDGDDTLRGTSAADRITGGTGNDALMGWLGNDTYIYNRGDGADNIVDAWIWTFPSGEQFGDTNVLSLGAGIAPDAIAVRLDNATRHVTLDFGGGDSVDIGLADNIAIQTLQFADGSTQGIQEFLTNTRFDITGTAAAETLIGTPYNDRIDGESGNDLLAGGAGSDIYSYKIGDGADTIYDNGRYFGAPGADGNTLKLGPGITPDMIEVRHQGDQCLLDLGGGDSIVVGATSFSDDVLHGFDLNLDPFTTFAIQTIEFDDGNTSGIQDLVTQRGLTKTGTAGADTLTGDDLYHGWIPDRLEGSAGNDTLQGGAGGDLYVFNRSDGADAIADSALGMVWDAKWLEWLANGANTLDFGAGIAPNDVVTRVDNASNHLMLDLGNGDSVDIGPQYDLAVQTVRFTGGAQYGIDSLIALRPVQVAGTADADYLSGSRFPNRIEGLAGDDTLLGGDNADLLVGGTGDDYLAGQWGSDTYRFDPGDGADTVSDTGARQGWDAAGQPLWLAQPNTLAFGPGIIVDMIAPLWDGSVVTLDLGNGDSVAVGSLTDVAIQTLGFDDGSSVSMQDFLVQKGTIQLAGTDGGDIMASFGSGVTLRGLGGDDQLYGSVRDDVLEGGRGNDLLAGAAGRDTYIYKLGDGADAIIDYGDPAAGDANTLSFGAGITPDMIAPLYDGGELTLDIGNGDSVTIGSINELAIQTLQFADGEALALDQVVALHGGFLQIGTPDNDLIYGTKFDDRLEGLAGDDTVYGDEGDDVLAGGPGGDFLAGGEGDDTYIFNRGDGVDAIADTSGYWDRYEHWVNANNVLVFGEGITPGMVTRIFDQNQNVTLDLGGGDSINIGWRDRPAIQKLVFSNGAAFPIESVWSGAPIASAIADQVTHQGASFGCAGAASAFADFDGDGLSYSATLADGRALPAWLAFDGVTGTFSGVPGNSDVASLELSVTATDPSGSSASSDFKLDVLNVNDAPTVVGLLPDQFAIQGQAFSFSLPLGDVGTGGTDGFLSDPADTGTTYSGGGAYDSYQFGGAGNDTYPFGRGSGNSYVSDWDWTPGNADAVQFGPDVSPADISPSPARWGDLVLSIDGSGDTLTLGSWLLYDAAKIEQFVFADGTVWGVSDVVAKMSATPTIGNDYIVETAGSDSINALAGDDALFGGAHNDTLLGGAGNDGLYGNGGSDVLFGGSGADAIVADNSHGDSAGDLLAGGAGDDYLDGSISNDLLIGGAGDDEVSGNDGNDVVLFNRGDGNDHYATDASENGAPLAQRTDTLSLGGGIDYADLAFGRDADDLMLHAGNDESITFWNWFNTDWQDNKAISRLQVVAEAMAGYDRHSADSLLDQRVEQFDFVGLANRFEADLAADPTITAWQLAPHLADFSLGGSDTEAVGGDLAYLYGKAGSLDRLSETEARVELTDARFGLADQMLTKAPTAVGTGVFDDIDFIHGDYLTLSATTADGGALPSWLSFDAATGTFSGTPANSDVGDLGLKLTATDLAGASASQTFKVTVANVNDAPVALPDSAAVDEDSVIFASGNVLANDFDIDADTMLTIADAGIRQGQFGTLALGSDGSYHYALDNAAASVQSLARGQIVTDSFNYTATDNDALSPLTATAVLTVDISGINDAPVVLADWVSVQEDVTYGATGNVLANDSDVDTGDALSVAAPGTVTGDYGTLVLAGDGSYTYTLANGSSAVQALRAGQTVTDSFGYAASDGIVSTRSTLAVTVIGANDAPVAQNDTGAAQEDGGPVMLSGLLLANDSDVDAGDTKTITAVGSSAAGVLVRLVGGDAVYDPAALFQTLKAGATTTDIFAYTMADSAGAESSAMVTMTIAGANDAPTVANPISDQSAAAGSPFNFSFAADTFFDIDSGDTLSYAAALGDGAPLPSWLSFDAATRTFTGTPPGGSAAASALQLRVDATDAAGASASDLFALSIAGSSGGGSSGAGDDDGHDSHQDDGGRGQHGDWNDDDRHKSDGHDNDRRDRDRHDDARHEDDRHEDGHGADKAQCHDARDAIAKRLEKSPNYDFTALSTYLAQQQGGYGALTPAQVAGQWRSVQERVGHLAQDDEDSRRGAHGGEHYGGDAGFAQGATFGGYAGATGQGRGVGGMATFGGLGEGFRKLG